MRRFDEAILAACEHVAHGLQRRTGMTGFSLAKLADLLMVSGVVRMYRLSLVQVIQPLTLVLVIGTALYIAGLWYRDKIIENFYLRAQTAAHPMQMRWREMWRWRVGALAAIPALLVIAYRLELAGTTLRGAALMLFSLAAGYYFRCVIPLPPGAVRDFQLYQGGVLQPVPVRNPVRK